MEGASMKQQWIMVMSKHSTKKHFGMNKSFSVTILGAKEAMEKANLYMEEQSNMFKDFEFKLQGGEW
jgi:hypothetical protein